MNITQIFTVLSYFIIPLLLTIAIELIVYGIFHLRKTFQLRHLWLAVVAMNMATNPALNLLSAIADPAREFILLELSFEIAIVFIEAGILYFIYKSKFKRFLLLSAAMNAASYGIGFLLYRPSWL